MGNTRQTMFAVALLAVACTKKPEQNPTAGTTATTTSPVASTAPSSSPAAAVDPQAELMKLGLDSLYQKGDNPAATAQFRNVLALNPTHYGARYQLAVALERQGDATAKDEWQKVLAAATAINDEQTVKDAKAHLGQ